MIRYSAFASLLLSLGASSSLAFADAAVPEGSPADVRWKKAITAPIRLELYDQNGGIRTEATSGDVLEIVAVKTGNPDDRARVAVVVKEERGVVVACARWPGQTDCGPGAAPRGDTGKLDVRVDFIVRVPDKVQSVIARTMNGSVVSRGGSSALVLRTMNGAIDATARGPLDAETMNGAISARMTGKASAVRLATKNGRVELVLPADADADVDVSTLRGEISSAFGPVPRAPFPGLPSAARFRLGAGGVLVKLETLNGDVRLQRGA